MCVHTQIFQVKLFPDPCMCAPWRASPPLRGPSSRGNIVWLLVKQEWRCLTLWLAQSWKSYFSDGLSLFQWGSPLLPYEHQARSSNHGLSFSCTSNHFQTWLLRTSEVWQFATHVHCLCVCVCARGYAWLWKDGTTTRQTTCSLPWDQVFAGGAALKCMKQIWCLWAHTKSERTGSYQHSLATHVYKSSFAFQLTIRWTANPKAANSLS